MRESLSSFEHVVYIAPGVRCTWRCVKMSAYIWMKRRAENAERICALAASGPYDSTVVRNQYVEHCTAVDDGLAFIGAEAPPPPEPPPLRTFPPDALVLAGLQRVATRIGYLALCGMLAYTLFRFFLWVFQ